MWRNSQTKLLATLQASGALVLGLISTITDFTSSDAFQKLLGTLTVPIWVPIALAVLGLITYLAHGHSDA